MIVLALALALTPLLGATIALAFYLVGGSNAIRGPAVVLDAWPVIYPLVVVFATLVGFTLARLLPTRLTVTPLALIALTGWIGEYLVLAFGPIDDDLNAANAIYFWLLATAGPLQPVATFAGGWLALRARRGDVVSDGRRAAARARGRPSAGAGLARRR